MPGGHVLSPAPKSVRGRTCFPKPSPDPALPCLGRASPTAGMFSRDSQCFGPSLGISEWGAPVVLTGPVLVPGVAADGLQQEAVVGHGLRAGDGARPPRPSGDAALAMGTSPQRDPCSQPHQAFPPAGTSPTLQPTTSSLCRGRGFPKDFQAQSVPKQGGRVPQWVQFGGAREGPSGAGGDVPHSAAPWLGTPRRVSRGWVLDGAHGQMPTAGCPMARNPIAGCHVGVP